MSRAPRIGTHGMSVEWMGGGEIDTVYMAVEVEGMNRERFSLIFVSFNVVTLTRLIICF